MNKEKWKNYYLPSILNFAFFLVIDICVLFGVCFGVCKFINRVENKDVVVAEVVPVETSTSSFEFNSEGFVNELRTKKNELEEYLNTTELNASERLAVANALSNLELAIGNIEVAIDESHR